MHEFLDHLRNAIHSAPNELARETLERIMTACEKDKNGGVTTQGGGLPGEPPKPR